MGYCAKCGQEGATKRQDIKSKISGKVRYVEVCVGECDNKTERWGTASGDRRRVRPISKS